MSGRGRSGSRLISPFHATFDLTYGIEQPRFLIRVGPLWYVGWIVAQAFLAFLLLLATLATFDRSIGRVRKPTVGCAGTPRLFAREGARRFAVSGEVSDSVCCLRLNSRQTAG